MVQNKEEIKLKTILYIRVSALDQNTDRQEEELVQWARQQGITDYEIISEKVSGSVPARDRALAQVFTKKNVDLLVVKELDRLGRDTLDIRQTISELKERGIRLFITNFNMGSHTGTGRKENPVFNLVIAVMAELAEIERLRLKDRQREGVAIAKRRGIYKGRKKGTVDSPQKVIGKYPKIVKELGKGTSIRRTAVLCDVSKGTVQKVKKALDV